MSSGPPPMSPVEAAKASTFSPAYSPVVESIVGSRRRALSRITDVDSSSSDASPGNSDARRRESVLLNGLPYTANDSDSDGGGSSASSHSTQYDDDELANAPSYTSDELEAMGRDFDWDQRDGGADDADSDAGSDDADNNPKAVLVDIAVGQTVETIAVEAGDDPVALARAYGAGRRYAPDQVEALAARLAAAIEQAGQRVGGPDCHAAPYTPSPTVTPPHKSRALGGAAAARRPSVTFEPTALATASAQVLLQANELLGRPVSPLETPPRQTSRPARSKKRHRRRRRRVEQVQTAACNRLHRAAQDRTERRAAEADRRFRAREAAKQAAKPRMNRRSRELAEQTRPRPQEVRRDGSRGDVHICERMYNEAIKDAEARRQAEARAEAAEAASEAAAERAAADAAKGRHTAQPWRGLPVWDYLYHGGPGFNGSTCSDDAYLRTCITESVGLGSGADTAATEANSVVRRAAARALASGGGSGARPEAEAPPFVPILCERSRQIVAARRRTEAPAIGSGDDDAAVARVSVFERMHADAEKMRKKVADREAAVAAEAAAAARSGAAAAAPTGESLDRLAYSYRDADRHKQTLRERKSRDVIDAATGRPYTFAPRLSKPPAETARHRAEKDASAAAAAADAAAAAAPPPSHAGGGGIVKHMERLATKTNARKATQIERHAEKHKTLAGTSFVMPASERMLLARRLNEFASVWRHIQREALQVADDSGSGSDGGGSARAVVDQLGSPSAAKRGLGRTQPMLGAASPSFATLLRSPGDKATGAAAVVAAAAAAAANKPPSPPQGTHRLVDASPAAKAARRHTFHLAGTVPPPPPPPLSAASKTSEHGTVFAGPVRWSGPSGEVHAYRAELVHGGVLRLYDAVDRTRLRRQWHVRTARADAGERGAFLVTVDGAKSGTTQLEQRIVTADGKAATAQAWVAHVRGVTEACDGGPAQSSSGGRAKAATAVLPKATLLRVRHRMRAVAYTYGGAEWERLFAAIDDNADGGMDLEVLRKFVRKTLRLGHTELTDASVRTLFAYMDADDSGSITVDELAAFAELEDECREEALPAHDAEVDVATVDTDRLRARMLRSHPGVAEDAVLAIEAFRAGATAPQAKTKTNTKKRAAKDAAAASPTPGAKTPQQQRGSPAAAARGTAGWSETGSGKERLIKGLKRRIAAVAARGQGVAGIEKTMDRLRGFVRARGHFDGGEGGLNLDAAFKEEEAEGPVAESAEEEVRLTFADLKRFVNITLSLAVAKAQLRVIFDQVTAHEGLEACAGTIAETEEPAAEEGVAVKNATIGVDALRAVVAEAFEDDARSAEKQAAVAAEAHAAPVLTYGVFCALLGEQIRNRRLYPQRRVLTKAPTDYDGAKECTFQPVLQAKASGSLLKDRGHGPVHRHLLDRAAEWKARKEAKAEELARAESAQCTFHPELATAGRRGQAEYVLASRGEAGPAGGKGSRARRRPPPGPPPGPPPVESAGPRRKSGPSRRASTSTSDLSEALDALDGAQPVSPIETFEAIAEEAPEGGAAAGTAAMTLGAIAEEAPGGGAAAGTAAMTPGTRRTLVGKIFGVPAAVTPTPPPGDALSPFRSAVKEKRPPATPVGATSTDTLPEALQSDDSGGEQEGHRGVAVSIAEMEAAVAASPDRFPEPQGQEGAGGADTDADAGAETEASGSASGAPAAVLASQIGGAVAVAR